jgi:hypothetical protein
MGTIDLPLATELRDELGLKRAIETGTYRGLTARALAPVFASVVTIELSSSLHEQAARALGGLPNVEAIQGDSRQVLAGLARAEMPTLYFLDGHWSGGVTDGAGDECPVLGELAAIGSGHPQDCLVIDDARLFTSAPPPPHDPAQWPTITEVFDAIRSERPAHAVTLIDDQVLAVPQRARSVINSYGARTEARAAPLRTRLLNTFAAMRSSVTDFLRLT